MKEIFKIIKIIFILFAIVLIVTGSYSEEDQYAIWEKTGNMGHAYMKAAHNILIDTHNNGELLTLGVVTNVLGIPDSIDFMGYSFDEAFNVMNEIPRFSIGYKKRGVYIVFTTNGLAESVIYVVDDNERRGLGFDEWPKSIKNKDTPVISPKYGCIDKASLLLKEARLFAKGKNMESDWYLLMHNEPKIGNKILKKFQAPCKASILIADCFDKRMARIHYKVEGRHKLFCDTWWKKDGEKWLRVQENFVSKYWLDK